MSHSILIVHVYAYAHHQLFTLNASWGCRGISGGQLMFEAYFFNDWTCRCWSHIQWTLCQPSKRRLTETSSSGPANSPDKSLLFRTVHSIVGFVRTNALASIFVAWSTFSLLIARKQPTTTCTWWCPSLDPFFWNHATQKVLELSASELITLWLSQICLFCMMVDSTFMSFLFPERNGQMYATWWRR